MCHVQSVPEFLNEGIIRSKGIWAAFHKLGHNGLSIPIPLRPCATSGQSMAQAYSTLRPQSRELRIKMHMDKGAPQMTGTRGRLCKHIFRWCGCFQMVGFHFSATQDERLQEAFECQPFTQLFAEYQTLSGIPNDNMSKMNLCRRIWFRSLRPGWPVQKEVADSLACLPEQQENPMKLYAPYRKE
ncbi:hypothetical protein HPG69_016387 [Diceros bicornis minor]|uniref:Uncharacterized protein n=1 Tax=Diceros bicornis minor TaxID=77932 RepID=A0A7J7EG84_DICBM|nr:hypothetical protein HPG69_016387 [Diceros bicornis minor]